MQSILRSVGGAPDGIRRGMVPLPMVRTCSGQTSSLKGDFDHMFPFNKIVLRCNKPQKTFNRSTGPAPGQPVAWVAVLAFVVSPGLLLAQDIVYKPIDVNRLIVRPSHASASLAEKTIQLLGTATANAIENNGYVKTINNLFGKKVVIPHTQAGPSPLPAPTLFPSTRYPNYNQPVPPTYQRIRR